MCVGGVGGGGEYYGDYDVVVVGCTDVADHTICMISRSTNVGLRSRFGHADVRSVSDSALRCRSRSNWQYK